MQNIVLILSCLAGTPEDACTRQTAVDVREVTVPNMMPMECAMAGLSTGASDPRGEDGLYTKIVCGGGPRRPGMHVGER